MIPDRFDMNPQGRLSVIIPAYEEKATLATLLEKVLNAPSPDVEKEIIAVESNSRDGTRHVVQEFERQHKVRAIYEEKPQGKGHAVKAGLAAATGDWILIQDADLEYEVADYAKLLEPLKTGKAAFVLGSRHLGAKDWRYRRVGAGKWLGPFLDCGVWLCTWIFNILYGVRLTDPATMFKVFRRDCLEGITLRSDGFDLDWELVAKLIRKGHIPIEVPVSYTPRSTREGKKIRFWRDGWRVFWAILRFRWSPL